MIVDTHVHYGASPRAHLIHDLLAESVAAGVDRIVQVTPPAPRGLEGAKPEEWAHANRVSIEEAARHRDRVAAVIVHFDVMADDAIARLEEFARTPGVLGFRVNSGNLAWFPRILEEPRLHAVLGAAEKLGTVAQIFAPSQTRQMAEIARRFPGLRILVDHMGIRFSEGQDNSGIFREWPSVIELANVPNVWLKVSYFPEAGSVFDAFPYPTAQQYFKELYERAGARRLLWGSNFPPVSRVCSYARALEFVRDHCTFLTADDRVAILGGNFERDFLGG